MVAARLLQLGASKLCDIGYGDDGTPNGGVFTDLDTWLDGPLLDVWQERNLIRPDPVVESEVPVLYRVHAHSGDWATDDEDPFLDRVAPLTAYHFGYGVREEGAPTRLTGVVSINQRLTAQDWEQDTRHVRIDISSGISWDPLPYRAGDVAAIMPVNSSSEVDRFLQVLPPTIDTDCTIRLECIQPSSERCTFWPERTTLRALLTNCMDIHGLPEREDLRSLSLCCSLEHPHGSDQRDKLLALSESKGAALYNDYILREKRSWAEVLYDFDSLRAPGSKLTMETLLTLLGPMRPREFSIASSPTALRAKGSGVSIELCVAVVEGTTPLGRKYHGLCSHYLSRLAVGDSVRLWLRPGTFEGLPRNGPVIYVGAGTGIAPMRALIQERMVLSSGVQTEDPLKRSDILLFGCRQQRSDFYYESEWIDLCDRKRLGLMTAFSRDQWHKIYVQQVWKQNEMALVNQLLQGALYIAGNPKMAKGIKDEVIESLAKVVGNPQVAEALLDQMQKQGRFRVEAWS